MAHELEIVNGEAQMFYNTEAGTPWHGLGKPVDGVLTAAKALVAAGLDWTVEKEEISVTGSGLVIPNRYANVRSSDGKPLGIVGGDYKVVQNEDAFSFFDTLVDSGEAKYETAGSLFGGAKIWLTAKIGDTMQVCGEDHDMYVLLSNTHDGSRALTAATTFIRVVCNNTETFAMAGAKTKWSLNHKQSLEGKADEARKALQISFKNADTFTQEVEKLMRIETTKDQFQAIIEAEDFLPPQKRQKEKNVAALMGIFENEPTINDTEAKGNAWGAYNAVTFWLDHGIEVRSPEARMTKLMDGFGARLRNKAHEKLLALA